MTAAEMARRYWWVGVLGALGLAAIVCSRQWTSSGEAPLPTPALSPAPNNFFDSEATSTVGPTHTSTPFPTMTPTPVVHPNEFGCFDFLGNSYISPDNKNDHYYQNGEFTPYTNQPEKGVIVFCDQGSWNVTIYDSKGKYHVLVKSPYQP